MKKEIFCSVCGHKFVPVGREHICPECKAEAAAVAKKAAVERAKARSYSGEACPVRISARARGFIEAVAQAQGTKFIPALDEVLKAVCKDYGFSNWDAVPEHKTARRLARAAKVVTTVTPVTPVKASTSKPQDAPQGKQDEQDAPQGKQAAKKAVKTTSKATTSKTKAASKAKVNKA